MHVCIALYSLSGVRSYFSMVRAHVVCVYFANTMNIYAHTSRVYIYSACFGGSIIWVITVIAELAELIAQIMGRLTKIISDTVFLRTCKPGLICCLSMSI